MLFFDGILQFSKKYRACSGFNVRFQSVSKWSGSPVGCGRALKSLTGNFLTVQGDFGKIIDVVRRKLC